MTDVLDDVRDHYRATGLTERLKTALTALGPEDQRLTPEHPFVQVLGVRGLPIVEGVEKRPRTEGRLALDDLAGMGARLRMSRRREGTVVRVTLAYA
jgi:hypothetical protein